MMGVCHARRRGGITVRSQQMAGCSCIICMHWHANTHSHTRARTAGAGRIHSELSDDGRILRSAVINGLIEAGAKMGGGPVLKATNEVIMERWVAGAATQQNGGNMAERGAA